MRTRAVLEVAAVILTAALHFVFYDLLSGRGVFIVVTGLAWSTYVVFRIRRSPEILRAFGLSTDGLRQSAVAASVILVAGIALCLLVGFHRGNVRFVP